MQGGAKEIAASFAMYASIAAFAAAGDREFGWRGLLPAMLCVSGGIAIFIVARFRLARAGGARRARRGDRPAAAARVRVAATLRDLAITAGVFAVIAVPSLVAGQRFVRESGAEVLNDVGETGNLLAPLKWIEAFGVWLTRDYRFPYTDYDVLTGIGIGIAAVLGIIGLGFALARRSAGRADRPDRRLRGDRAGRRSAGATASTSTRRSTPCWRRRSAWPARRAWRRCCAGSSRCGCWARSPASRSPSAWWRRTCSSTRARG